MKTVESFDKHYCFIIATLFCKNRINLTEENKKQEPCRQHSTMSLLKYQNQYPKIWNILEKSNFTKNMIPKKGYSKIWEHPIKVPKNPRANQKKYPK